MNFLPFFYTYFLHLLFGALCICGWFAITRGYLETMPDGKKKARGKILKGWYLYWFQEKRDAKLVYYKDEEFYKMYLQVNNATSTKLIVSVQGKNHLVVVGVINTMWKYQVEQALGIKIITKSEGENTVVHFAKEYIQYRFPEWVRDVMAGCITCHSSWLGSICFWVPVAISSWWDIRLTYGFTGEFIFALLSTWVAYCVSLAFITTALWKKYMP